MVSRYTGHVGEYMWQKEKQFQQERMERLQDRPWELQSGGPNKSASIIAVVVLIAILGLFFLFLSLAG